MELRKINSQDRGAIKRFGGVYGRLPGRVSEKLGVLRRRRQAEDVKSALKGSPFRLAGETAPVPPVLRGPACAAPALGRTAVLVGAALPGTNCALPALITKARASAQVDGVMASTLLCLKCDPREG
jgi:hypothetical protein